MLDEYGWVDQKAGIARLPIDEAKKQLLHERPAGPRRCASRCRGSARTRRDGGESSGGRTIPIRQQVARSESRSWQPDKHVPKPDAKAAANREERRSLVQVMRSRH